ncbi:MAG: hypothetical protein CMJ40_02995 [Phycisphaerae bacterium]|nr:hypothetical protein [Phycisphaerae bacterium]
MSTIKMQHAFGLSLGLALPALVLAAGLETPSIDPEVESIIPEANPMDHEHKPRSLMMRFKESASASERAAFLAELGGTVRTSFTLVPNLVEVTLDKSVEEGLAIAGTRSDVLQYVEPNYIYRAFDTTPNDPAYSNLCGMESINAPAAWDDHIGDESFVIAIIDTGIDYNHPDLVDNMWRNPGEIPGNGVDDDNNGYIDDVYGYDFYSNQGDPMDTNGHGTHCGGTVGGQGNNGVGVAGVMWECSLAGVQFLGGNGSGSLDGAVGAVQYCRINNIPVSNNSWDGGGFSQSLYDAINNAGSQVNHVFVAAAGNSGTNGASYPAAYDLDNIIAVAATDCNDNLANFSQYSATQVDVAAVGVDVYSSTPGNNYDFYSGTSMATPHVAGAVGLVYSVMGEDATPAEVKALIMDNVRPVSGLTGRCVTGGVIDVAASLANTFLGPQIQLLTSIPESMDPNVSMMHRVQIDPREDNLLLGSVKMRYRMGDSGGFETITMTPDGLNIWAAEIPGAGCDESPELYFEVTGQTAGLVTIPSAGPFAPYGYFIGEAVVSFSDDFNSDKGWTVSGDASDGGWTRGIPVNCNRGDPVSDYDGSASAFLTDNSINGGDCNSDVDNGSTVLLSPVFDASGSDETIISYARWHSNNYGDNPGTDPMIVEISNDYGLTWSNLETVGPTGAGTTGGWIDVSFKVEDVLPGTALMQVRFTVSDLGDTQSVVESGIDAFSVEYIECGPETPCDGDIDGNQSVTVEDLLVAIGNFGNSGDGDVNNDGSVTTDDILIIISNWGPCDG